MACLSGDPDPNDPRGVRTNKWLMDFTEAPTRNATCCFPACFLPCCAAFRMRQKVLNDDLSKNTCCMGYAPGADKFEACFSACPNFVSLCCEAVCCTGPSLSSTRHFYQDIKDIQNSPCDNRIIALTNFCQIFACVFSICAMATGMCEDGAQAISLIAECMFMCTAGCMAAQLEAEMTQAGGHGPLTAGEIDRMASPMARDVVMFACCCGPPTEEDLRRDRVRLYERSVRANGGRLLVQGILQRADAENRNDRIYPLALLQREVAAYQARCVSRGIAYGELNHPDPAKGTFQAIDPERTSHRVVDLWWTDGGCAVAGILEVLDDRPAGRRLRKFFSTGQRVGISSRVWASLDVNEETEQETVCPDMHLIAWDTVPDPGVGDAWLLPIPHAYVPPPG